MLTWLLGCVQVALVKHERLHFSIPGRIEDLTGLEDSRGAGQLKQPRSVRMKTSVYVCRKTILKQDREGEGGREREREGGRELPSHSPAAKET